MRLTAMLLRPVLLASCAAALAVPKGPSFLGAVVGIGLDGSPWEYMLTLRKRGYDGVARVPLGPAGDYYFLLSPEAVKAVVLEKADAFPRRFSVPLFRTLDLDRGIVYEQGARQKRQKKLCVPAFEKGASMESFLAAFTEEAAVMAERWRGKCAEEGSAALDLYAEMRALTLAVVLRVTFGLDQRTSDFAGAAELSTIIGQYLEAIVATANEVPPLWQVYPPLSRNYVRVTEELLPRLRALVSELIAFRRAEAGTKGGSADLLSVLAADATLTDDDIQYVLFDLVIAGSDTTASTLAAALFLLHVPKHSAALERARAEADAVDLDALTLDAVRSSLPVHGAIARETLRLYPPVPFVGRTAARGEAVGDADIPKDAVLCFSPYFLGRDPSRWADPDAFDIERWLADPATGGAPSSFSWLPFGAGPRGCLGTRLGLTEAILGVARVLRDFDVAFDRAGEDLAYKYDLTLNLGDSTTCRVTPR